MHPGGDLGRIRRFSDALLVYRIILGIVAFWRPGFFKLFSWLEEVPTQVQLALPDFYLPPLKVLEPSPGQFELHCGAGLWGLGSIATGLLRAMAQECQISAQV